MLLYLNVRLWAVFELSNNVAYYNGANSRLTSWEGNQGFVLYGDRFAFELRCQMIGVAWFELEFMVDALAKTYSTGFIIEYFSYSTKANDTEYSL